MPSVRPLVADAEGALVLVWRIIDKQRLLCVMSGNAVCGIESGKPVHEADSLHTCWKGSSNFRLSYMTNLWKQSTYLCAQVLQRRRPVSYEWQWKRRRHHRRCMFRFSLPLWRDTSTPL
jgi:hypothetical protein